MKPRHLIALLCVGYFGWAQAEIYKYVDVDGHVTYSSTPKKGAKKLNLEPLPGSQPATRARPEASPADFPKVDGNTQKTRDSTRRKILEDEMAAEEKLLAESRQNLKNEQARNVVQPEAKMKAMQEEITLHEKNVDALKAELGNIK